MRSYALLLVSALALTSAAAFAETTPAATPPAPAPAAGVSTPAPTAPAPASGAAAAAAAVLTQGISADIGKVIDQATVPALQNILQPGSQLRYIGDEHGLKAYFATNGSRGQVVYITPDGQASFIGAMFTADGVSMSMLQLTRLRMTGFDPVPYLSGALSQTTTPGVNLATSPSATGQTAAASPNATPPAPQLSLGEQLLADANQASWIAFGQPSGVPITVFMDPNCDHCHAFFKQLMPSIEQNKIYLRVIPVSVIAPQKSGADVINLLSSPNPQDLWTKMVNGQPIPDVQTPNTQAATALRINNQTFGRWSLPGTPYSIYRDRSGTVKVLYSEPENLQAFLQEIGAN